MRKKPETVITELTESLLATLGITAEVRINEVNDEYVEIVLETAESGIVIGHHGEVLDSLQTVLSLMFSKQFDRFFRVLLEVGDYKKAREDYLRNLVSQTREKVIAQQREYALSRLRPWERRIIHMMLENDKDVRSESVGEGKERTLLIKPRGL